jgi:hypothetical protein
VLLPGVGSVTVADVATVAVFTNEPVAAAEILQLAVYVTLPIFGKLTVSLTLPEPDAVQVPPLAPTQVHVHVSDAGNASVTFDPGAALGPLLFVAVIVYVTEPPGVAVVTPSVLVMARFACGVSVSVSVAVLLPGVGSVTVTDVATVEVFTNEPVAAPEMLQLAVYVTLPVLGRLTVSLILPEPDAVHVPPFAPTHVHVHVSDAGNVSVTFEPGAALGPLLFVAVIVYVTEPPGVAVVTPSVFVMARFACGVSVSVSVAVLLAGVGSVTVADAATVAVFTSEPVADGEMLQLAVYVILPVFGKLTVSLILPEPDAVQVPPFAPTQVHVQVNAAGNASETFEPGAALGPELFDAVIV